MYEGTLQILCHISVGQMCEGTLQILCHIHRADINLLTKPNKMKCLYCTVYIEKLEMSTFSIGRSFIWCWTYPCEIHTKWL